MTTFQAIIDAVLRSLAGILPISYEWALQIEDAVFHTGVSTREMDYLVSAMLTLVFLVLFRYDWLGLTSAMIRTIIQPTSLKPMTRTLDQEAVIFLVGVSIPLILARYGLKPMLEGQDWFNQPITQGILFLVGAGLTRFAYRWNKRIRGLNHLRMIDCVLIFVVSLLSMHHALPAILMLWIGFSLCNYHYESIFKYSMLIVGILHASHFISLTDSISLSNAMGTIGYLNSIAVLVVSFSIIWMTLDNLQRTISENTFRSFQWLQVIAGISTFGMMFLKG